MLGIVGIYKEPEQVVAAAKAAGAKYKKAQAFSPYPIHALFEALKIRRSRIPWVTLVVGLGGLFGGWLLTYWTSVIDWPLNVGGKPLHSLPAFVPILFECTILLGGIATFLALWIFCRLPNYHTEVFDLKITDELFAVFIPAENENFQEAEAKNLLQEHGAYEIKLVQ